MFCFCFLDNSSIPNALGAFPNLRSLSIKGGCEPINSLWEPYVSLWVDAIDIAVIFIGCLTVYISLEDSLKTRACVRFDCRVSTPLSISVRCFQL
jgi:hypothetical protein